MAFSNLSCQRNSSGSNDFTTDNVNEQQIPKKKRKKTNQNTQMKTQSVYQTKSNNNTERNETKRNKTVEEVN